MQGNAVGGDGAEARRAAKDARLYRSTRGSSGPVWPASFFVTYENSVTITLSTQWHYCQHVNLRNLLGGMDAFRSFRSGFQYKSADHVIAAASQLWPVDTPSHFLHPTNPLGNSKAAAGRGMPQDAAAAAASGSNCASPTASRSTLGRESALRI